uniref:Uncharacterized protein LOC105645596 isoform X2 n=1 Tax=Rhizophora mucronata TaxID=61149 RepID=A0A2P2JTF9_RHIMU
MPPSLATSLGAWSTLTLELDSVAPCCLVSGLEFTASADLELSETDDFEIITVDELEQDFPKAILCSLDNTGELKLVPLDFDGSSADPKLCLSSEGHFGITIAISEASNSCLS